jgi:hypothetical protein
MIMEPCCGLLAVEIVPGKQENTAISAPILPREREFRLAHAQMCSFIINEQFCGPLSVEMIPGNSVFSAPILPRERELSLAHAQRCLFLIMEQRSGSLTVKMRPGNTAISAPILARERSQSRGCAEVQFNDNRTELWFPVSRNFSRKAL